MLIFSEVAFKRESVLHPYFLLEKAKDGGTNLKTGSFQVELDLMVNISTKDITAVPAGT